MLLHITLRAGGHNQTLSVSLNTRLININLRHVYSTIRQGLWCAFYEISLPNKGKRLTNKSWRNDGFRMFLLRLSFRLIQGHHYKRLQLNNYGKENATSFVLASNTAQIALKYTAQSVWTHNSRVQAIYNVSRSYQVRHGGWAQRADISQMTFSYVFSLMKILVFRFELHSFVPRVKLAIRLGHNGFR